MAVLYGMAGLCDISVLASGLIYQKINHNAGYIKKILLYVRKRTDPDRYQKHNHAKRSCIKVMFNHIE